MRDGYIITTISLCSKITYLQLETHQKMESNSLIECGPDLMTSKE